MKIIFSIKIKKENVRELAELECMDDVMVRPDGHIECVLKESSTRGNTLLQKGDWLVRFENGEWQRFGNTSYMSMMNDCQRRKFVEVK